MLTRRMAQKLTAITILCYWFGRQRCCPCRSGIIYHQYRAACIRSWSHDEQPLLIVFIPLFFETPSSRRRTRTHSDGRWHLFEYVLFFLPPPPPPPPPLALLFVCAFSRMMMDDRDCSTLIISPTCQVARHCQQNETVLIPWTMIPCYPRSSVVSHPCVLFSRCFPLLHFEISAPTMMIHPPSLVVFVSTFFYFLICPEARAAQRSPIIHIYDMTSSFSVETQHEVRKPLSPRPPPPPLLATHNIQQAGACCLSYTS